jgi:4'-phosphopantetheinyl transferase
VADLQHLSGSVDIWRISLREERGLTLSTPEIERAARFRFDNDRERWSRARSALRNVLARYTQTEPLSVEFVIGEHGKPALPHPVVHFNISHSGYWALIAVSREAPVGVDVERMRERVDIHALLRRLGEENLPDSREACYARWAHREAKTKAAGGLLLTPPPADIYSEEVEVETGYAAAVALQGMRPVAQYYSG